MKFTCESCSAQYMISDEKVGPSGVKVRCKKCGNVILVRRAAPVTPAAEGPRPGPGPEASRPAAEPAAAANGSAPAEAPAAPAAPQPAFDAELGEAFDNVFREGPAGGAAAPAAAPATAAQPDLASTQLMGSEDAAKVFSDRPAGPAATEWYVAIGQAQVGPLPLPEVKKKWEAGDVGPDSLVWRPGMADWSPLSTVTELAGYLAPVPRASAQPARPAEPRPEPAGRVEPAAPASAEPTWKPVGASALAALASEELAARTAPEPRPAAKATQSVKSIVDALPDGGGVDPTGALPLNIKALEATTGEKKLERRTSLARGVEQARQKRSSMRAVSIGLVALVGVAAAAAGGVFAYQKLVKPAPVAVAPPAPPPVTPPVAPPSTTVPAAATPPPTQPPPAAQPAAAQAEAPAAKEPVAAKEPPAAAPPKEPAKEPAPEKAVATGTRRTAKPKPARAEPPPRRPPTRVAQAEPPPANAPPARRSGGLLDFESNDKALDEALGGKTARAGRSVYVPPAPTGGGALPAKVSPGDINAAVAGRIDSLRRCVSEQKAREPDASGTLKMRWIIQGDGSVSDVKCLTPQYAQGAFAQCIGGVVKGIRFPRSATTGQEVTFPFNF